MNLRPYRWLPIWPNSASEHDARARRRDSSRMTSDSSSHGLKCDLVRRFALLLCWTSDAGRVALGGLALSSIAGVAPGAVRA
jgi:hypothetical protein